MQNTKNIDTFTRNCYSDLIAASKAVARLVEWSRKSTHAIIASEQARTNELVAQAASKEESKFFGEFGKLEIADNNSILEWQEYLALVGLWVSIEKQLVAIAEFEGTVKTFPFKSLQEHVERITNTKLESMVHWQSIQEIQALVNNWKHHVVVNEKLIATFPSLKEQVGKPLKWNWINWTSWPDDAEEFVLELLDTWRTKNGLKGLRIFAYARPQNR